MITMQNFIGNTDLIKELRISIVAARVKNCALPHLLLQGPAGTGKTTLAEAVAREFGSVPMALTPNTAKTSGDLRKLFLRMPGEGYDQDGNIIGRVQPQIVFVDEVHQLSLLAQENLGIAMQDWKLPVKINGVDVFEWVPRFTLIGATTLAGKLSKPFLDRFKLHSEFETYTRDEAVEITRIHAKNLGIEIASGVAEVIARRARGIPRLVVRFLERVHDALIYAAQQDPAYGKVVTPDLAEHVLQEILHIDDRGLTRTDIKVLKQLMKMPDPIGLESLAAITNEDKGTIEHMVEPYLVQEGLVCRTKRGRVLTDEGRRYLESEGYVDATPEIQRIGRLMGAQR